MISLIDQNMEAIRELCRRHGVARLEVFGSASGGAFDPDHSDVDFLIEFPPGCDFGQWMDRYLNLKDGLEKLLGREVDLVELKSVRNPFRLHTIHKSREVVYAA